MMEAINPLVVAKKIKQQRKKKLIFQVQFRIFPKIN